MASLIKQCDHKYTDDIEGFNTCLLCGLVLYEQVFMNTNLHDSNFENRKNLECSKQKSHKRLSQNKQLLKEMYNRDFFSYEIYCHSKILIEKWLNEKVPFVKYHSAYAVYYSSKLLNFPIIIHQILSFLNIDIKEFFRLEKIIPSEKSILPSKYVNKFGGILKISYPLIHKISILADKLILKTNITPICLAISLIYISNKSLDVSYLSLISYVSIPSIKKWSKILKDECF